MTETTASDAVLARLEALTARLDRLETENAGLKAENARLMEARPSGDRSAGEASASRQHGGRGPAQGGILKRRGLLAGAAALAAGGLAKLAGPDRAQAGHNSTTAYSPEEVMHLERANTTALTTAIHQSGPSAVTALEVLSDFGVNAITGSTSGTGRSAVGVRGGNNTAASGDFVTVGGIGVFGFNDNADPVTRGVGVSGEVRSASSVGVRGENRADVEGAVGVQGVSGHTESGSLFRGIGVHGLSGAGTGVRGDSTSGFAVLGQSTSSVGVQGTSTNSAGVYGSGPIGVFATGTGTAAVYGASNGTYGVWGNSASSAGLIGTSASYIGVQALSTNHWGLHAKSPNYAGVFEGNVFVTGQVIALGGVVGLSTQTTTRATVEDVGEAALANGRATITLAQDFADAANGDYRVFLTELADLGGLYVVQKGPRQFEVRSRGGGQAAPSGRFDYRVVARLAGPPGTRQAPLAPPDLTTVKPTPKPPEPPRAPEPSGGSDERRRP